MDAAPDPPPLPSVALREGPGTRIGPYKLVRQIGEGGFGAVFMAEQEEPVRRVVALKIIKLGMDTRQVVARFEQERQALAMMDHPNIARVIDAGTTSTGRPYFVMDLVKGDPISEFCDKNHLTVEERLELFAQVCDAIQHAHTKGIIHRDLKPSNILVSLQDGRPASKVIDFGIAKATSQKLTDKTLFTAQDQVVGTIQYMSPEQTEGSLDIDTRSDVYALGVVLYELLTGTTPFDAKTLREAAYSEVQRMIREDEPLKPSTRIHRSADTLAKIASRRRVDPARLGALVRGELDWIVMKALEKDRARRYDTASGFALDVRRYLDGEAVVAAPPGAMYRFRKFVRRHRVTATAGAAVAVALLVGVVGFASQARVARRERDAALRAKEAEIEARKTAQRLGESEAEQRAIAETNGRKAAAINQFLLDMLASANVRQLGRDAKVSQALDRAAEKVDTAFADRPEVEAAVRRILGATYLSIGMLDASEPQVEAALELNRRLYGDASIELAHSLSDRSALKSGRGDLADAADLLEQAVAIATKVKGPEDPTTLGMRSDYANALARVHRDNEAEAILREILETRARLYGRENDDTQVALNSLAVLLHGQGKLDEAEALYREAVELGSQVLGPAHPDTLTARVNLASLLRSRRQFAECEPMMIAALADTRRVFGEEHSKTAGAAWALAGLYRDQGRYKEALPLLEDCLASRRRDEGEKSRNTIEAKSSLSFTLKSLGEVDRAVALQREVVAAYSELQGEESEPALNARLNLANTLRLTEDSAETETVFRELLESSERNLGTDNLVTIIATNSYGVFLMGQDRFADAEPYVRRALEVGRRVEGEDDESTIITQFNLAYIEFELGRFEEAERLELDTIERFTRVLGPGHPTLASARGDYGRILARLGRNEEARAEFAAAIAISQAALGKKNPRFCKDALELGRLLVDTGAAGEAEPILREVLELYEELRGPKDVRTAKARIELGRCFQALGRFDEAEKHLVDGRDAIVAARPAGHEDVQTAERFLAEFYASRK